MAVYRNIQITFWTDTKILDNFTPEDKYFYLYLFTNPHTNLCGCYEISKRQVALETGYSIETIERLLDRFKNIHKVIDFSESTKEVFLLNWHKYNWTKSADFRKALYREISNIKNADFKRILDAFYNGVNTVSTPSQDGGGTTDTVSVTDTVTVSDSVSQKFIPPTREEVQAYCKERKNSVDAESFVDFYTSKGWMVGKNKMKDWKACVRTWEKSRKQKTEAQSSDNGLLDDIEQFYLSGGKK